MASFALALLAGLPAPASAQLDPLLFIKRVPPTVILAVDTSMRMLEDGSGRYYDTNTYWVADDPMVANAMGVDIMTTARYRRIYHDLRFEAGSDSKFEVSNISTVADFSPQFAGFWGDTRLEIAKAGMAQAVRENSSSPYRWGLIRLRQSSPAWRLSPNCDKPVHVLNNANLLAVSDSNPCGVGSSGRFGFYRATVSAANFSNTTAPAGTVVVAAGSNTGSTVAAILERPILDPAGLIPASRSASAYEDRPLTFALQDARAQAVAAMSADAQDSRSCRNTVVVLVTGGRDDGDTTYQNANDPIAAAGTFQAVTAGGVTRRVPVVVIAIRPNPAHEQQLQDVATASGGQYFHVTDAAGVTAAINYAVQLGFSQPADFETAKSSEFQPVSPIVGTVNMTNGRSVTGAALPNTDIQTSPGGQPIPQRSNVMITAGFALPGFDGRIRAFRTYRPEPDSTKAAGWKFVADGTRLWPDLDGRLGLAGLARVPADPDKRNIYTFVPDASGGGQMVAFTAANAGQIGPHLGPGANAAAIIDFVRDLPLGAIIGSTPALMDPPSLDPPPDDDYGRPDAAGSFADTYKDRRSTIWVGTNNGMVHAIDARTGYEVWAFIPYNLLPKLRTLLDGQPVDRFDYFVDSSPKVAELKMFMPNGEHKWRSMLFIGQGYGGTFYQAFDITEAGMDVDPEGDDLATVNSLLTSFANTTRVQFKWAFPNYSSFDPNYSGTFAVADGMPGGQVRMYGDLKSTATTAEKTVGFTWSDPAVGPLDAERTVNVLMVGSGYFPDIEDLLPGRGSGAPRAGRSLYLIRAEDGKLLGNAGGGPCNGTGCRDVGNVAANDRKNAIQADPSAAGATGSHVVTKAYVGDIDGRYWRFNFTAAGAITNTLMVDTAQPIYSSSALLFLGTVDLYMFFSTGSDLLPVTTSGGTGTFTLYGLKDLGSSGSVQFTRNLATVTNTNGVATGERSSTSPSVAGDIVFFTTTSQSASTPCSDFTARLYAMTYLGGAAYDSTGDDKVSAGESPVVRTVAGRATAPFIVDQHLYFGTSGAAGANLEVFGDPEDFNNGVGQVGVRILSWRELR